MKKYFDKVHSEISLCSSDIECRVRVVSNIRLLLQQVTYGLLEWLSNRAPAMEQQPDTAIVQSLRAPADGALVDALEALVISCEQTGWRGISRLLVRQIDDRPSGRLCNSAQKTTIGLLRGIVSLRNDGAEGHGLVGGYDREAELDALRFLIDILAPALPVLAPDGVSASIGTELVQQQLAFLKGWNGAPALIRRIKILATDRVRTTCQVENGSNSRDEFQYEAPNPFRNLCGRILPSLMIWENTWEPLYYLPEKTTDSFTGREEQIGELKEWFDDEDSRACLIYGDGGLGKTTLALEFLHRILDEELDTVWRPVLVLFYTAKRWQWGLNGLQPISAGQPHLLELLSSLHVLLFGSYPSNDFYRFDITQAASNLQGKITNELKVTRKEILIVIDNTETLIENDEERISLGKELKEISKRIGRVLLTSRRREHIEATPIGVDVLLENEAIEFIRERARKLDLKLVKKADDSTLLDAVNKLERRPIVLEAFINALADPSIRKIEQATTRVASMLRKDLGDFLFSDAWARLSQDIRRLLLLMTRIGDVHDEQSLKICASICGVSVQSAEQALEESGGIASVVNVQGALQVTFSKNFLEYAKDKQVGSANGAKSPSVEEVRKAQFEYSAFIKKAQAFSGDRIAQAFRTPQARAAHRARADGQIEESRRLYESAILTDSTNGWLFDRFAFFLFKDIHDNDAALHQAKHATELLPEEGEVWYTRGLIESRLGQVRPCELSMAKAENFGIAWQRCSMQRAWAYLKAKPLQLGLAEKELSRLRVYVQANPNSVRDKNELVKLEGRLNYLKERRS